MSEEGLDKLFYKVQYLCSYGYRLPSRGKFQEISKLLDEIKKKVDNNAPSSETKR